MDKSHRRSISVGELCHREVRFDGARVPTQTLHMSVLISMQLWAARKFHPLDPLFEYLAELGYEAVETYTPLFADDPRGFRRRVDAHGLRIPSLHMELSDLVEQQSRCLDAASELGAKIIIVPHLHRHDPLESATDWLKLGEDLSRVAESAQQRGFMVGWSNHAKEYVPLPDGRRPIDCVLAPSKVSYEPGLGWLARQGQDIKREFALYGPRIHALRIKDTRLDGTMAEAGWDDIGCGAIGYEALWPDIMALPNLQTIVVDHDDPTDFRRFARRSMESINQYRKPRAAA